MFSNPLGYIPKDFFVRGLLCGTKYAYIVDAYCQVCRRAATDPR